MELKSVDVLSCGKVSGLLYLIIGFIFGFFFSVFAILGTAFDNGSIAGFGIIFGVGAIIFFPIMYGVMGFVGGVLCAALYNLIARLTGGIRFTLESTEPPASGL